MKNGFSPQYSSSGWRPPGPYFPSPILWLTHTHAFWSWVPPTSGFLMYSLRIGPTCLKGPKARRLCLGLWIIDKQSFWGQRYQPLPGKTCSGSASSTDSLWITKRRKALFSFFCRQARQVLSRIAAAIYSCSPVSSACGSSGALAGIESDSAAASAVAVFSSSSA